MDQNPNLQDTVAVQQLSDSLDRALADVAAGRTENWAAVRDRMDAAIKTMEDDAAKRRA